jgi:hypothetical protein
MADTVDTTAPGSLAEEAEKVQNTEPAKSTSDPHDAAPVDEAQEPPEAVPTDEAQEPPDAAPTDETHEPLDAAPVDEAQEPPEAAPTDEAQEPPDAAPTDETQEPQDGAPTDETERQEEEAEEPEEAPSVPELLEQLGHELGELGASEAQLEAGRNMPEVRRAVRDIAGILVVVLAAVTSFAFVNVAAMDGLSRVLTTWQAALALAAGWIAVSGLLLFGLMGRARRWLVWIAVKAPPMRTLKKLERERDAAGRAALSTLEQLAAALAIQIALAAVPKAGDVASGVVETGDSVLEASDEIVEEITEAIPGGGVIDQVWDVVLMPGRLGVRVATTVLRRGKPTD